MSVVELLAADPFLPARETLVARGYDPDQVAGHDRTALAVLLHGEDCTHRLMFQVLAFCTRPDDPDGYHSRCPWDAQADSTGFDRSSWVLEWQPGDSMTYRELCAADIEAAKEAR